ncbi:MAG: hypothetical protein EB075_07505 [Bacteroidetes bacterium]|nr:hypothetical protein [Bacteroidota bacterium]
MFEMFNGAKILEIHGLLEGSDLVTIVTDKMSIQFHHWQQCCEVVSVAQVDGDVLDVVGKTIHVFEERSSEEEEDWGWRLRHTFYTVRTSGGDLTWRWDGRDNGYYSVAVHHRFRGDDDWVEP